MNLKNLSSVSDGYERNPQYDEYLKQHISNVSRAAEWLWKHNIISKEMADVVFNSEHDASKYSEEEYQAYADYFYGEQTPEVLEAFDVAWLHHQHNNPHHWQYWCLIEDDAPVENKLKALEMPEQYVIEMICDWWSFSWSKDKLDEIFNWYDQNKDKQVLHPNTRKLVEALLNKIRTTLEL